MDANQLYLLIQELDEKLEMAIRETNKNMFQFTTHINALFEILGLSTDQSLDFHNLPKKKFRELLEDHPEMWNGV